MSNPWRNPIVLVVAAAVIVLGVGVAHAKGSSAGQVVSLLSRGSSSTPTATPTASAQPTTQTFQLTGGMVTVTCAGGVITVNDVTPNAGFDVKQEPKDEDAQVEVRFESAAHESRLEVECVGNVIQVEELREEAVEEAPPPAPPAPAPTTAPQSMTQTFSLVGGTVTVTCTGNVLTLNSVVPNAGFSLEQELKDEQTQLEVRFESDTHRSRIELACAGGQVIVEELREESH